MLLPRMKAPASFNAFISAWCFSGSSNIQWWSKFSGMSPKGFSKLWLGPATKASNDIVIEQVTLFMRFSPISDSLSHHIVPPLVNAACMTVLVNALRSEYSTEGMEPIKAVSCNERQKQPSHSRPQPVEKLYCRAS